MGQAEELSARWQGNRQQIIGAIVGNAGAGDPVRRAKVCVLLEAPTCGRIRPEDFNHAARFCDG